MDILNIIGSNLFAYLMLATILMAVPYSFYLLNIQIKNNREALTEYETLKASGKIPESLTLKEYKTSKAIIKFEKFVVFNERGVSKKYKNRFEFPEQYFDVCLGVLTYFSTFIKDNYPDLTTNIEFKQEGNVVYMNIDGDDESVADIFTDYMAAMSGEKQLAEVARSELTQVKLEMEKAVMMLKIDNMQKFHELQNRQLQKQDDQILEKDIQIEGLVEVLRQTAANSNVVFNPSINVAAQAHAQLEQTIEYNSPALQQDLTSLIAHAKDNIADAEKIQQLEAALKASKDGDEAGVKKYLGALGKWAVDTSTKLGVPTLLAYGKHHFPWWT